MAPRARNHGDAPHGVQPGGAPRDDSGSGPHAESSDNAENVARTGEAAAGSEARTSGSRSLEIVIALVAAVVSGLVLVLAGGIEVRAGTTGIDARWWPRLLAIAGSVLSFLLLLRALTRPPFSREDLDSPTRAGWIRASVAIALAVAFVLVWPIASFLPTVIPFLIVVTYVFGGRGWRTLVIFPVLISVFIYLVFGLLLKVPL